MDMHRLLSALLQLLVLIPGAVSCYLPAKGRMRFTPSKTAALCAAVLLPCAAATALLYALFSIHMNWMLFPSLALFFFLYRRTVDLDLPRSLAIYVGVCAIESFPAQFACSFDAFLHPASSAADLSPEAALFQLMISLLLLAAFFRPVTRHFTWTVDRIGFPKIWYSTVVISAVSLIMNVIAIPQSYATLHTGRMYWIFPVAEAGALAVLTGFYILFYRGAALILEQAELKERFQLLEMQSRQYHVLLEHVRQTAKLRHDFRHSLRLIASLAEQGDNGSIRAHVAEYETILDRHAIANYCKNATLNALFGHYHEIATASGIRTDWSIELPEPFPFLELDMTGLFGNLMDNAIAGCLTVPEASRYFCLTTQVRHGRLYVVSTNSFDGKVLKGKEGYLSTKDNGNGIGLSAITAAAEKYGGSAKASNSNTEFFVDIVLKI